MLLKDLNLQNLVDFCNGNTRYNSKPWWIAIYPRLARWLQRTQGRRELFLYIEHDEDPQDYAENDVDVLLEFNSYKYDHLWKLYTAEYNPIWNVEGTETLTIHREESSERDMSDAHTGDDTVTYSGTEKNTKSGNETMEKAGTEKVTRTGNETDAKAGTETKSIDGSITEANSGGIQQSRTTYDSSTAYDTDKTTDTTKKATTYGVDGSGTADPYSETESFSADRLDTHTYNSVSDEQSFNGRKDTHTYNSVADEKTFTNRDDKTTFNSTHTVDDDTSGTVDETQTRTRGGNIGVTMTQQMEQAEVEFVGMFRFLEQICVDIAGAISYTFN